MILFLAPTHINIEYALWTMFSFEALSGIKINFQKTKLVPLHMPSSDGKQLADLFGCKLAKLPLKYLGVPLANKKLALSD